MPTPESIKKHSQEFKDGSWRNYTFEDLGKWVHLLTKRAYHRTTKEKRVKDLYDAQQYLNMMQAHLDEHKEILKELPCPVKPKKDE